MHFDEERDDTEAELIESTLLTEYYNRLVPVLDVKNLSAHFVSARILDCSDEEEISQKPTRDQAKMVLRIIERSLSSHTDGFYSMLNIMVAYGNQANKVLAKEIKNKAQVLKATKVQKNREIDKSSKSRTETVDNPDLPSKVLDKTERKIPKEILKYTKVDLQKAVKDVLPKFDEDILIEDRDKKIIEGVLLLLMVVNPSEFLAAMNFFSKSKAKILNSGGNNYYVGKWGQIPAALVQQSEQGIGGPGGAQQLTCSSINLFKNLKVIIALGVCGTVGQLGDVIVSSRIDGCNCQKIKGNRIISRSLVCRPGKNIRGFLMLSSDIWSFPCTKEGNEVYEAKAVFKPMLSGTPLIASGEYRDKLLDNVSVEAGGVEMEGIGVVYGIDICNKKDKIEFIIVKAGCDYADEEKNKEWQPVAAMAAADFVYKQLDKPIVHNWFFKDAPAKPLIDL